MSEKNTFTMKLRTHFEPVESDRNIGVENVYAHGSMYKKVFGRELKDTDRRKRFVKITSMQTKRSVYRILRGVPTGVESKDTLYMDSDAKSLLGGNETEVKIKKCSSISFYWNTDNLASRISFRIGVAFGIPSLVLGIISLVK